MLGSEVIKYVDDKFLKKEGNNWRQWEYLRVRVLPEEYYEVKNMQVSWHQFTSIILEKWVMSKMKDIC